MMLSNRQNSSVQNAAAFLNGTQISVISAPADDCWDQGVRKQFFMLCLTVAPTPSGITAAFA